MFRYLLNHLVPFVGEGSTLPTGYGVAWYSPVKQGAYAAPIPFNWLLGKAVYAYWTLVQGPKMPGWLVQQVLVKRAVSSIDNATEDDGAGNVMPRPPGGGYA